MRKDVECTFGIMKGRWRILKTGIRLHSIQSVDMIWATCCALHNMLLEGDGLDEPWDGVRISTSQWTGNLGEQEVDEAPFAMHRLFSPADIENDTSSTGQDRVDGDINIEEVEDGYMPNVVREVGKLGLGFFRSKLVEHFNIAWKRNEVVWPSRKGSMSSMQYLD